MARIKTRPVFSSGILKVSSPPTSQFLMVSWGGFPKLGCLLEIICQAEYSEDSNAGFSSDFKHCLSASWWHPTWLYREIMVDLGAHFCFEAKKVKNKVKYCTEDSIYEKWFSCWGCPKVYVFSYEDDILNFFWFFVLLGASIIPPLCYVDCCMYCIRWILLLYERRSPKDNLFGFVSGVPSTILFYALFICATNLSPQSLSAHSFKHGSLSFHLGISHSSRLIYVDLLPYLVLAIRFS